MDHSFKNNLLGLRHLKDENNLATEGRDNHILPEQDESLADVAREISFAIENEGCKRIVFYTSPKRRGYETLRSLKLAIDKNKLNFIDTINYIDSRIADLNQGKVKLPAEYKVGDKLPILQTSWNCFWSETFDEGNFVYRFGDSRGKSKVYDELKDKFLAQGESYAEFLFRTYDFIQQIVGEHNNDLQILIAHSAQINALRELNEVAGSVNSMFMPSNFKFGSLPYLTRESFENRRPSKPKYGELHVLSLSEIDRPEFKEILEIEKLRLKSVIVQSYGR